MPVSMTLTMIQGHSGSAKANNQLCMLSATNQVINVKLVTTVSLFWGVRDLDFANVYTWLDHLVLMILLSRLVELIGLGFSTNKLGEVITLA